MSHMTIHGHEILHHLLEKEPTPAELRNHVCKTYGSDVRFRTCSAEDMSLEELIVFLKDRKKFILLDGKMVAQPEKMCSHSD
jgi:probable metal-binding protein